MSEKIKFKFAFGDEVRDTITGFKGKVTANVAYITGCNQCLVSPACKDTDNSTMPEGRYLDEGRLEMVKAASVGFLKSLIDDRDPKGFGPQAPVK